MPYGWIINPVGLAEVRVKELLQRFSKRACSPLRDEEAVDGAAGSSGLAEIRAPLVTMRVQSFRNTERRSMQNWLLGRRRSASLLNPFRPLLRLGFVSCARNVPNF
jgi:hypothetical protein